MNNRKLFWSIGAVVTFGLFYFVIPPVVYNAAPLLLSFIGAALLIFFLVQAIWDFKSFQSFNKPKPEETTSGHKVAPFMVIPGLIMIFVFYIHSSSKEKEEIKKDGTITEALIIDGSSSRTRNSTTYKLDIGYNTKEGKYYRIEKDVSSDEFDRVYKGEKIPIMYSNKNPELVEVIISDKDIKEYFGIESRSLRLSDLYKLFDIPDDTISNILNKISFRWTSENDSGKIIWENPNTNEVVVKNIFGILSYVALENMGTTDMMQDIKTDGFVKISKDSTGREIFENKKYRIATSTKLKQSEDGGFGFKLYRVINLFKLDN